MKSTVPFTGFLAPPNGQKGKDFPVGLVFAI